ncbi:two-component system response regulator YesN [Kineothrix alysoides]|uniref:Stage 0 sporulation protein A homolog n=1 Tax=Kineothrix alysoides TaxID=1469948 RepID=A0A4R1R6H9_9FIRM|nr:response regulator [Kineothrix alysoides]TCL61181.1 two-component system response regulator YesN [Kineothrix alysoides]
MYTVLIADDEASIREGLKYIMDWASMGFSICGETANGEETLQAILQTEPNLVLLDIRMPKMYGTDIIRIARENGYRGKFIILSGYSDFAYAQTAIRYGASFYLTKPIEEAELQGAVEKVKEILIAEKNKSDNIALFKSKARESIIYEVITGMYDSEQPPGLSESELEELHLTLDIYQVVIYEKFSSDPSDPGYSFAELLKITNKGNHTFDYFKKDNNEIILLKGSFAINKFQDFLLHYEDSCPQSGSPLASLFLAYGRPVSSLEDIHLSYEEASALKNRRFFCIQGQHTLGFEELPDVQSLNHEINNGLLTEYSNRLTGYLLAFNRRMVAETLSALEDYLYEVKNDISSVKLFLTDLYLRIKEKINHTYGNPNVPFPNNAEVISHIEGCHHLYEIILYISEMTDMIMSATGNPSRDTVLDDIIYYIDHNFQKNIKLESIAPLFGYNSAYLGKIFNKHLGESFNSYVDHRRIDQSLGLLKEKNLKVYEISEQVGYKNVDYFHKKFKKYIGMSPAEYRKKLEDEGAL